MDNEIDEAAMEIIELAVTSIFEDATDWRISKKKVTMVNIKAYENLMGKYTKTMEEIVAIKKS